MTTKKPSITKASGKKAKEQSKEPVSEQVTSPTDSLLSDQRNGNRGRAKKGRGKINRSAHRKTLCKSNKSTSEATKNDSQKQKPHQLSKAEKKKADKLAIKHKKQEDLLDSDPEQLESETKRLQRRSSKRKQEEEDKVNQTTEMISKEPESKPTAPKLKEPDHQPEPQCHAKEPEPNYKSITYTPFSKDDKIKGNRHILKPKKSLQTLAELEALGEEIKADSILTNRCDWIMLSTKQMNFWVRTDKMCLSLAEKHGCSREEMSDKEKNCGWRDLVERKDKQAEYGLKVIFITQKELQKKDRSTISTESLAAARSANSSSRGTGIGVGVGIGTDQPQSPSYFPVKDINIPFPYPMSKPTAAVTGIDTGSGLGASRKLSLSSEGQTTAAQQAQTLKKERLKAIENKMKFEHYTLGELINIALLGEEFTFGFDLINDHLQHLEGIEKTINKAFDVRPDKKKIEDKRNARAQMVSELTESKDLNQKRSKLGEIADIMMSPEIFKKVHKEEEYKNEDEDKKGEGGEEGAAGSEFE